MPASKSYLVSEVEAVDGSLSDVLLSLLGGLPAQSVVGPVELLNAEDLPVVRVSSAEEAADDELLPVELLLGEDNLGGPVVAGPADLGGLLSTNYWVVVDPADPEPDLQRRLLSSGCPGFSTSIPEPLQMVRLKPGCLSYHFFGKTEPRPGSWRTSLPFVR